MQSVFLVFTCMYPQGFMQDNVFASDSHFQSIADDMYDLWDLFRSLFFTHLMLFLPIQNAFYLSKSLMDRSTT